MNRILKKVYGNLVNGRFLVMPLDYLLILIVLCPEKKDRKYLKPYSATVALSRCEICIAA